MTTDTNLNNAEAAAAILAAQAGQGTAAVTPTTEQTLILTRDGNVCFFYGMFFPSLFLSAPQSLKPRPVRSFTRCLNPSALETTNECPTKPFSS